MPEEMPEFDPPPIDVELLKTPEGQREWVLAFCARAAKEDLRHELERQREERLRRHPVTRFALRMFSPVLVDPLDLMLGPKESRSHGK
jgi:hypothetical protein